MENRNTAQEFLLRNSHENKIIVGSALIELWTRHQSALNEIELLKQALAGYADYMEKMDQRLEKLEPKITIVSEHEAKNFLKG